MFSQYYHRNIAILRALQLRIPRVPSVNKCSFVLFSLITFLEGYRWICGVRNAHLKPSSESFALSLTEQKEMSACESLFGVMFCLLRCLTGSRPSVYGALGESRGSMAYIKGLEIWWEVGIFCGRTSPKRPPNVNIPDFATPSCIYRFVVGNSLL